VKTRHTVGAQQVVTDIKGHRDETPQAWQAEEVWSPRLPLPGILILPESHAQPRV
jgi:hypothetical protein